MEHCVCTDHVVWRGHGGDRRADGGIVAVVWRRQQHGLLLLRHTNHTQAPRRAQIAAMTCDTCLYIKPNLFILFWECEAVDLPIDLIGVRSAVR